MIQKANIILKGKNPLIMHNGAGANPIDPRKMPDFLQKEFGCERFIDALKPLKSKRGKTDADYSKLAKLSFYSSLYVNEKEEIIFPSECLEKMIQTQAKENKKGKLVERGISIPTDAILEFPNKDKPLKDLFDSHRYDTMVKISQSKTASTRAIFQQWSCEFEIEFHPKIIDLSDIKDILSLGEFYGCLERRPKFGRYTFEVK